jgi:hypothetical protein
MSPPPKVRKPAVIAIRATAPRISNQRGTHFSFGFGDEPV